MSNKDYTWFSFSFSPVYFHQFTLTKFTNKYVKVGTIRRAAPVEVVYDNISPKLREEVIEPVVEPGPEPHDDDAP